MTQHNIGDRFTHGKYDIILGYDGYGLQEVATGNNPLWWDADNFIGEIAFDAMKDLGTGFSYAVATTGNSKLDLPFRCEAGDDAIYGILVAIDALTPTSGQIFRVNLQVAQH